MTPPAFHYATTALGDLDELVGIRIDAMRESLEQIGRFDPARARERFATSFEPERTRFIVVLGERVGFVVLKERDDGLLLDHLYLRPSAQGAGIGSAVLRDVLAEADRLGVELHVGALRESASNRFYQRHGFLPIGESDWDIYYRRPARARDGRP